MGIGPASRFRATVSTTNYSSSFPDQGDGMAHYHGVLLFIRCWPLLEFLFTAPFRSRDLAILLSGSSGSWWLDLKLSMVYGAVI